jgi:hypothetical protein
VNNGDGTISVDITIRHPFPANRYYTGFDVRGILYTPAHCFFKDNPDDPDVAWLFPALETGDPEVLNPDGYTNAFSPFMPNQWKYPPILKYQPGGDLGGTFDEDDKEFEGNNELFPFICYYSSEVRRHFATNEKVTRTYHIALPPGPWEFGYSVDACWAPPINVPVLDVETDFPMQANTLLTYKIDMFISGPLVGIEPSTVTIRVYSHFTDVLELFGKGCITIHPNRLTGYWEGPDEGPIIVGDDYVEYTYELVNLVGKAPGIYPILVLCSMSSPYLDDIELKWWLNASYCQILWVTVES